MTPAVRAVADRFILDSATLKYLASCIPKGGVDRPVEALGWTVRQAIGHIVASQERYGRTIGDLLAHTGTTARLDVKDFNAAVAKQTRSTPLPDLLGRLDLATARLLAVFEQMPFEAEHYEVDGRCLAYVLGPWSRHAAKHGIDLVDALPEVRFDPMILNWILYADYSGDERRFQSQLRLMADVREQYADEEEPDEEDDNES